jgi:hypothetical protein
MVLIRFSLVLIGFCLGEPPTGVLVGREPPGGSGRGALRNPLPTVRALIQKPLRPLQQKYYYGEGFDAGPLRPGQGH